MQIVLKHRNEINLFTFLQLIMDENGIGLYQHNVEVFRVDWETIDEARKMFRINKN